LICTPSPALYTLSLHDALPILLTSAGCQDPSAEPHETVGALRSTLLPETGPAVAELPTASATDLLPVDALGVSVLAGTVVFRVNVASAGAAGPAAVADEAEGRDVACGVRAPASDPASAPRP